jgi:uncharacterized protein (TIGR00730 family)
MGELDNPLLPADAPEIPEPLPRAPLAYENAAFLDSADGRIVRILSEYSEPLARFRREQIHDTVVFFGSARLLAMDEAQRKLELLTDSASDSTGTETGSNLELNRAHSAVEMARYYEDARRLAFLLTEWSLTLKSRGHRFVVTSGGGGGIMEAANRGAREAGGKTIGMNIRLPFEYAPNPYITPALNFEFHYFFMRKYWFAYLAKALVVFPGGFGTIDELFEVLTLAQTNKLSNEITVLIYGSTFWNQVLNFDVLVDKGLVFAKDRDLLKMVDTPEAAFKALQEGLTRHHLRHGDAEDQSADPEIAHTF